MPTKQVRLQRARENTDKRSRSDSKSRGRDEFSRSVDGSNVLARVMCVVAEGRVGVENDRRMRCTKLASELDPPGFQSELRKA